MTVGGVRGVVTLLVKRHITQVVSRDPVMRCSPVPALSSAIHVTISEEEQQTPLYTQKHEEGS